MAGWLLLCLFLATDDAAVRDAVAALQRGDFPSAEKTLRAETAAHPEDAMAWSLLGVALDGEKKFSDAGSAHRRAVSAGAGNADILSNYGNHFVATGDETAAIEQYRRAIAAVPGHANATLQLARIALERKDPKTAEAYLDHLASVPPQVSFSLGVAFAAASDFASAEKYFAKALAGMPGDFNVLVNLGSAAASAGHYDRARESFQDALRQQPRNVEVLYQLAAAEYSAGRADAALKWLAPAARLAPERPYIQRLLALAATDLGALDDAVAAWDRYLKLAPQDDVARRERAYTLVRMGQVDRGAAALKEHLAVHPDDPIAQYQLGVAEQDVARLGRAIALKPGFAAALSARGGIYYQQGKFEDARRDLEAAVQLAPDDPLTLDRLGQTYASLDRPADAVRVLRRAAQLAPSDSKTQLHLARALSDAGLADESKAVMDRFRQLGPASKGGVPAGLVDYLALSPEDQKADYRARVEKAYHASPGDPDAQLHYLRLLLEEGKVAEAAPVAHKLAGAKQAPDAGRALIDAGQWNLAKELLNESRTPEEAIADLHLLEDAGKTDEAAALAVRGPNTPEFRWHAVAFLVRRGRPADAEAVLSGAGDDRETLRLRAAVLAASGKKSEADAILAQIRQRWPEWPPAWKAAAEALSKPPREW